MFRHTLLTSRRLQQSFRINILLKCKDFITAIEIAMLLSNQSDDSNYSGP